MLLLIPRAAVWVGRRRRRSGCCRAGSGAPARWWSGGHRPNRVPRGLRCGETPPPGRVCAYISTCAGGPRCCAARSGPRSSRAPRVVPAPLQVPQCAGGRAQHPVAVEPPSRVCTSLTSGARAVSRPQRPSHWQKGWSQTITSQAWTSGLLCRALSHLHLCLRARLPCTLQAYGRRLLQRQRNWRLWSMRGAGGTWQERGDCPGTR